METPKWTCETCQKEYDMPPKWCPCTPYPMDSPHKIYAVVELSEEHCTREYWNEYFMDEGESGYAPSLTSLIADSEGREDKSNKTPFKQAFVLFECNGWAIGLSADDELEALEATFEKSSLRHIPAPASTGYLLIRESYRPGIETLDFNEWACVDIEKEEFVRLGSHYL